MGRVKRVESKGKDVVCVALLPELGAGVRVPEHNVVWRVDGEKQVSGGVLAP